MSDEKLPEALREAWRNNTDNQCEACGWKCPANLQLDVVPRTDAPPLATELATKLVEAKLTYDCPQCGDREFVVVRAPAP